jgi:hypothetical protein
MLLFETLIFNLKKAKNMKEETPEDETMPTRIEIAMWYRIGDRGLRKRMEDAKLRIKNRVLTLCDLRVIIKELGMPPAMPSKWHNILFGS